VVRRQRTGLFSTTLSSGVSDSATSWTVDSASGMPTEGDFYANCELEIVLVTHISGTTLTVIRGCCGTSAAAHGSASKVHSILTREEYVQRAAELGRRQVLPYGLLSTDDGTILTVSDFTEVNPLSGSSADGQDGTIVLYSGFHTGNDLSGLCRNFRDSSGGDRRYTAHLQSPLVTHLEVYNRIGLYLQENSTGLMYGMELTANSINGTNPAIAARSRSNFLDFGTVVASHDAGRRYDIWIQCDMLFNVSGSDENFIFRYSWDGVHWFEFYTFVVALTNTIRIGMWANNRHITGVANFINSWYEEVLV